jgi:predicted ATPase
LDNKPVTAFATDKARALLAYLVLEAEHPHRRDALSGLLWPDQPQKKARRNLRQALSYLRRAIADHDPDAPYLLVGRETVQFNPKSDHWLDVTAFTALLDDCQTHHHRRPGACRRCMQRLEHATDLYQGSFLEDFALDDSTLFEEWAALKREWLHRLAADALLCLADCHERRGQYARARHHAQRQVELDPWREEAHRQLMRLLAFDGQRDAALAQYETCRQFLAAELGVEPIAETTALYERIRAGESAASYPRPPAVPHNLPPSTPFVGRAKELIELADRLADPDCRLLTLVGPGGIGKTRLALQAAAEQIGAFAQGVYFVPLASVASADSIVPAIAHSLQFPFYGQDPTAQLLDYLREKEMLLVLDNMEHLLEGVGLLTDVLHRAPGVALLVTSRERLNLRQEWVYEVEGLTYPSDAVEMLPDSLESYSAVDLFAQSARRVHPGFTLSPQEVPFVVDICYMVDGMPLGVELAAAWVPQYACQEIAQEIAHNLDFLSATRQEAPERHRSLRAVFEHSWRLLAQEEQAVFTRLSVFRGGFDRRAAQRVAGASLPTLLALLDKSLLRQTTPGRYQVHEILRQYAVEKQAPQEREETRARHSHYYAAFLHTQEQAFQDPRVALQAIETEIDNVRSAWHWAVSRGALAHVDQGLNALARFYYLRGPFQVGETLIRAAVDHVRESVETTEPPAPDTLLILGKLLVEQARLLIRRAMYDQAIVAAEAAIELASPGDDTLLNVEAAGHLLWGRALFHQANYEAAQTHLERALDLVHATPSRQLYADSLRNLGSVAVRLGDYDQAGRYCDQALHIYREIGDRRGEGAALNNLSAITLNQGDYAEARTHQEQARQIYAEIGDRRGESKLLNNLGNLHADQGDYAQAQDYYVQALRIHHETGSRMGESVVLNNLAGILWSVGDYAGARARYARALEIGREIGDRQGESIVLSNLSLQAHSAGDDELALDYGQQALRIAQELGDQVTQGDTLTRLGHVHAGLERWEAANAAYGQALELRRELGQPHRAIEALAGLADVFLAQGEQAQAQAQAEKVLSYLENHTLDGVDEPFRVYLTCYRVLHANQDPRAASLLATAHHLLQEWAAKISDEKMRHSFLKNVTIHQEIAQAFAQGA